MEMVTGTIKHILLAVTILQLQLETSTEATLQVIMSPALAKGRELVSLQEKLDSLLNQKPKVSVVEESTAKSGENLTNDVCMASGKDEKKDRDNRKPSK